MIYLWIYLGAAFVFAAGLVVGGMLGNAKHADEMMRVLMELEGE